jgi:hypothetical protein
MKGKWRPRVATEKVERPILLSGFWVRQALAGKKSQTRRVVGSRCTCPYGKPGDFLWVREAWQIFAADEFGNIVDDWEGRVPLGEPDDDCRIIYAADDSDDRPRTCSFRPSIHMPRWASRLLLEVKHVRVEHLGSISEADVRAEGIADADWRESWVRGWDLINARRGFAFAENPLVWVVTFKVAETIVARVGNVPVRVWPMH